MAATYALDGKRLGDEQHPVALVAAAAAAAASGDQQRASELLGAADALDARAPSYFGAAWIALGRLWLDTDRLGWNRRRGRARCLRLTRTEARGQLGEHLPEPVLALLHQESARSRRHQYRTQSVTARSCSIHGGRHGFHAG